MSQAGLPAGPPGADSAYDRFWKHPLALVPLAVLGICINVLIVVGLSYGDDVEPVQAMQVGDNQYALYFHRTARPYNTVTRNGRRIFDSREPRTGNCLRLKRRADGAVALECMHAVRRETIELPLP